MRGLRKLRDGGAANAGSADARPRGRKLFAASVLAVGLAGGLAACGGSSDDDSASGSEGGSGSLDLVAYSTPQTVYEESIIPAFQETPEGEGIEFSNSFGASGDQSRAVEAGQPADFVHLPLEPDIMRLVDAGLVSEDCEQRGVRRRDPELGRGLHHAAGQPEGHHRLG